LGAWGLAVFELFEQDVLEQSLRETTMDRGQDPGPFFLSERGERLTRW